MNETDSMPACPLELGNCGIKWKSRVSLTSLYELMNRVTQGHTRNQHHLPCLERNRVPLDNTLQALEEL